MTKLSVVIITLNEEETIARCIDSVIAVADEIIVLDSFSADGTVEIARSKGAIIFQEKFAGYTAQKNSAIAKSAAQYVFAIDADEAISEELLRSIQKEKEKGFPASAYQMNRLNFFGDRAVKTCGWYPDTKIRLWNKDVGGWTGNLVHEKWSLNKGKEDTEITKLEGDLLHYTYKSKEEFRQQVNRFAKLAAQSLKNKNIFVLLLKLISSSPAKFFKNYFLNLGFTDGALGFTICSLQAREAFQKYFLAIKFKYA